VIREDTQIGDRVVLQPGVVIGGDGFGYVHDEQGHLQKVPQVGCVVIEDDVEIGANSTIDRATLGVTRIRRGAKIDNLVQIAHNCDIGEDAVIVAQTGLSGSTIIGRGRLGWTSSCRRPRLRGRSRGSAQGRCGWCACLGQSADGRAYLAPRRGCPGEAARCLASPARRRAQARNASAFRRRWRLGRLR
jgi:hypothetical protein